MDEERFNFIRKLSSDAFNCLMAFLMKCSKENDLSTSELNMMRHEIMAYINSLMFQEENE